MNGKRFLLLSDDGRAVIGEPLYPQTATYAALRAWAQEKRKVGEIGEALLLVAEENCVSARGLDGRKKYTLEVKMSLLKITNMTTGACKWTSFDGKITEISVDDAVKYLCHVVNF